MGAWLLIPRPETIWCPVGRLLGRAPVPLSERGRAQIVQWAAQKGSAAIARVYCGDEVPVREAGRLLARHWRASLQCTADLGEVDLGLWEGLTVDELRRRFPKVFRRWYDDPASQTPPGGEPVADARERIGRAVARIQRWERGADFAVIAGPLALAIWRCLAEGRESVNLREWLVECPWRGLGQEEREVRRPPSAPQAPATAHGPESRGGVG